MGVLHLHLIFHSKTDYKRQWQWLATLTSACYLRLLTLGAITISLMDAQRFDLTSRKVCTSVDATVDSESET
jgi:hypothetical protein